MRRFLVLALAFLGVAMVLWWLGGMPWPGRGGEANGLRTGDADPADAALLRGRQPEAAPAPSVSIPWVPDAPPDWAFGTITGRVVGPDGQPLPNSGAAAVGVLSLYGSSNAYRDAPADEAGHFVLHAMAGLATVVVAGAEGHSIVLGPRVLLEEGATRDVGTLRVQPEHRLRVRVVDEEGAPIEDVEVSIEPEADPLPEGWRTALRVSGLLGPESTDEEGRVGFDMLPAGSWRVLLDTGEFITWDRVREHVEADGEEVLFVLPAATAPQKIQLPLKVLGPDGSPVPIVRADLTAGDGYQSVWLEAASPEPLELESAIGPVRLTVREPRDAERNLVGYAPVVIPDVRGVEPPLVVRMLPGATITGRVDWDGEPSTWRVGVVGWLDPVTGRCVPTEESDRAAVLLSFSAQTQADGSFLLVGVPPGRFALRASGPGRLLDGGPIVEAGASGVVLTMVPEGRMEVHVLPPERRRFGNVALRIEEWVDGGVLGSAGWNGGGGDRPDVRIFHADSLRMDGRYRLRAWGTCSGVSTPVAVLEDAVPREAPYVLQLVDAPHVQGVVEREDGTPVWGMQVRYRPWPGGVFDENTFVDGRWLRFDETDATGAFELAGMGEREVVLAATGLGLVLRDPPPTVAPGTSGIRLVVVPERRISGRVQDPAGGVLDGLRVAAVPAVGRPVLWTPYRVMADGFFEVCGLAPGTVRLVVWNARDTADSRSALSDPLPVGQQDARVTLRPGPVLTGVVRGEAGRAVPGAEVRLLGPWTNRAARTDAEGRYVFTGIPRAVDLELEVVTPTGRSVLRTVRGTETADPTPHELDVTLPKR